MWTAGIGHPDDPTVRPYTGPVVSRVDSEEIAVPASIAIPILEAKNVPECECGCQCQCPVCRAARDEPCPDDEPATGNQPDPRGDMLDEIAPGDDDLSYKPVPGKTTHTVILTPVRENVVKTAWGNVPQNEFGEGA